MTFLTHLNQYERGLRYERGAFTGLEAPGLHCYGVRAPITTVTKVSVKAAPFAHPDLAVIARVAAGHPDLRVVDVKDGERALVWLDERCHAILAPGVHAFWTVCHTVTVETVDIAALRFTHAKLKSILATASADAHLLAHEVPSGFVGLLYVDGQFRETLAPGQHVFWKHAGRVQVAQVDLRERVLDVSGQEIMTADKVTLRLNALVSYRVLDAVKATEAVDDFSQALYREAQMALRAVIGTRELDALLANKDEVTAALEAGLRTQAAAFGVAVLALGIRDLILPGEMKTLLNRVTEAKKAAEAALITRREETAAMRSQANTAKILDDHPTLMRLRELEVLEKVADKAKLTVVLGEKGLADRVTHLL